MWGAQAALDRLGQPSIYLRRTQLGQDAAIDVDNLASDVAGVFRGQERDRPGDVFGIADATQRNRLGPPPLRLFASSLELLGVDRAGPDHVDTYAKGPEVDRHAARHRL